MRTARRRTRVGIRDVKAKLSSLIRRVREGEEIEVTDHGRPVAWIVPIEQWKDRRDVIWDEGIEALMRAGYLREPPPRRRPKLPPPIKPLKPIDFTRMIREDRDSRP